MPQESAERQRFLSLPPDQRVRVQLRKLLAMPRPTRADACHELMMVTSLAPWELAEVVERYSFEPAEQRLLRMALGSSRHASPR